MEFQGNDSSSQIQALNDLITNAKAAPDNAVNNVSKALKQFAKVTQEFADITNNGMNLQKPLIQFSKAIDQINKCKCIYDEVSTNIDDNETFELSAETSALISELVNPLCDRFDELNSILRKESEKRSKFTLGDAINILSLLTAIITVSITLYDHFNVNNNEQCHYCEREEIDVEKIYSQTTVIINSISTEIEERAIKDPTLQKTQ